MRKIIDFFKGFIIVVAEITWGILIVIGWMALVVLAAVVFYGLVTFFMK